MSQPIDMIGQRFGLLTVLRKLPEKKDKYSFWECICDCGNLTSATTKMLKRGTVKNCGCIPKNPNLKGSIPEDITGQRFGKLTAIRKEESIKGRTRWLCSCDCGGTKIAFTSMLKTGKTRHCGCELLNRKGYNLRDLLGQRFGRLTVVREDEKRDEKGSVIWECLCDCGNTTFVPSDRLLYGKYRSCGCLKREISSAISEQLHFVDGTCVEFLRSHKHRSVCNNVFRGVYQTKHGTYKVKIGLKGKTYYLGTFHDLERAIRVRLDAEQILHDGLVMAWDKWKSFAEGNPVWAENNPFVFDVTCINGQFIVDSSGAVQEYHHVSVHCSLSC